MSRRILRGELTVYFNDEHYHLSGHGTGNDIAYGYGQAYGSEAGCGKGSCREVPCLEEYFEGS